MGLEEFKKTTGDILRALRASQKAPGGKPYIYGRRKGMGGMAAAQGQRRCRLNEAVQKEFSAVRDAYNLKYSFPWD